MFHTILLTVEEFTRRLECGKKRLLLAVITLIFDLAKTIIELVWTAVKLGDLVMND